MRWQLNFIKKGVMLWPPLEISVNSFISLLSEIPDN